MINEEFNVLCVIASLLILKKTKEEKKRPNKKNNVSFKKYSEQIYKNIQC